METSKLSANGYITVPARLRKKYGMKKGTKYVFIEVGENIILQPITKNYFEKYVGIFNDEGNELQILMEEKKSEKKL
ncbi:MAG: AbrB/MazE/SpoVT family DNA-binding domain-containing protein [Ignavibacteria bacterium]|nr:AbrB/MazE/SpoVT family DNA-binding domain-containing protein [Ignavibacteria bacterium]